MPHTPRDVMKEHGISPSVTRTKIYAYLDDQDHHPTVDDIYQALIDELPTLSKTTVYNTLRLFVQHGLVRSVMAGTNESRYELYHEPHSHFRCETCNTIYDIPNIKLEYQLNELNDFLITDEDVTLSGQCPACRAKFEQ